MLSERIANLTDHFKTHVKDNHSRRGLIKLVSQRRRSPRLHQGDRREALRRADRASWPETLRTRHGEGAHGCPSLSSRNGFPCICVRAQAQLRPRRIHPVGRAR